MCVLSTILNGFPPSKDLSYKEWINLGIGFGHPIYNYEDVDDIWILGISYNFGKKRLYHASYDYFVPGLFSKYDKKLHIISFGIGKRFQNRIIHVSGFISPTIVYDKYDSDLGNTRQSSDSMSLGVATNCQLFIKPFKEIGVGIVILGIVTTEQQLIGMRLSMHFNNTK